MKVLRKVLYWLRSIMDSAFDSKGRFKFLLGREADPEACRISGVPFSSVDQALELFCDAFDILPEQKYCLRPSDLLLEIYQAMVRGLADDLEFERLWLNLEEATGREIDSLELIPTIEELCRWYCRHRETKSET